MNSDQTKKAREMIFGIHVHIIQGSIHAKFQDPASRKITSIQNGQKWLFYRIFRGSTIVNSKIDVLRKQKKSTDLISKDVYFPPFSHQPIRYERSSDDFLSNL